MTGIGLILVLLIGFKSKFPFPKILMMSLPEHNLLIL